MTDFDTVPAEELTAGDFSEADDPFALATQKVRPPSRSRRARASSA